MASEQTQRQDGGRLMLRDARELLAITWPMTAGAASTILFGVIDAFVAARLGGASLAAVALGAAVFSLAAETLAAMALGFQTSMARLAGAKRDETAYDVFGSFLWLIGLLSLAGMTLVAAALVAFPLVAPNEHVADLASVYLAWRIAELCAIAVSMPFRVVLNVHGRARWTMAGVIASSAVNTVLSYLLAFGHGGLPEMGIAGIGLGSALAALFGLLFYAFAASRLTQVVNLSIGSISKSGAREKTTREEMNGILQMSKFEVTNAIIIYVGNLLFIYIIGFGGASDLAASRVAFTVMLAVFVASSSLGVATQILAGRRIGAGDRMAARRAYGVSSLIGVSAYVVGAGILMMMSEPIARAFGTDLTLTSAAASAILMVALAMPAMAWTNVQVGLLRALGASKQVALVNACAIWLVQLPIAWAASPSYGLQGCYAGVVACFVARACLGQAALWRYGGATD